MRPAWVTAVTGEELFHECYRVVEGAVDDVYVVDFGGAEEQREEDGVECDSAGAEDREGVDCLAAAEEEGRGEGGGEGGEFGGGEDAEGGAVAVHYVDYAFWGCGLGCGG